MDFSVPTILIVPLGLGLLGFVEPCTVGGHLLFLRLTSGRTPLERTIATVSFALVRTLMMGSLGAVLALVGQQLIQAQTTIWIAFGLLYVAVGLGVLLGWGDALARRIDIAPTGWKLATNPLFLGAAFGLNVPACAAPILFGLLGLAASGGTVILGFATMAVFGLGLSLPLIAFIAMPVTSSLARRLATGRTRARLVLGPAFLALGLWSIWFGLFVEPAEWARLG